MCSNKLADRFTEEVNRIGVSKIAKHLGKARNTIYNWCEKGNIPADQIHEMMDIGIDVVYVIMGRRVSSDRSQLGHSSEKTSPLKIEEDSKSYTNSDQNNEVKSSGHSSGPELLLENSSKKPGALSREREIWNELFDLMSPEDRARLRELGISLADAAAVKKRTG